MELPQSCSIQTNLMQKKLWKDHISASYMRVKFWSQFKTSHSQYGVSCKCFWKKNLHVMKRFSGINVSVSNCQLWECISHRISATKNIYISICIWIVYPVNIKTVCHSISMKIFVLTHHFILQYARLRRPDRHIHHRSHVLRAGQFCPVSGLRTFHQSQTSAVRLRHQSYYLLAGQLYLGHGVCSLQHFFENYFRLTMEMVNRSCL